LEIKVLENSFLGNSDYWEKQRLRKEYFGSPALGKKPWEKRLLGKIALGKVMGKSKYSFIKSLLRITFV